MLTSRLRPSGVLKRQVLSCKSYFKSLDAFKYVLVYPLRWQIIFVENVNVSWFRLSKYPIITFVRYITLYINPCFSFARIRLLQQTLPFHAERKKRLESVRRIRQCFPNTPEKSDENETSVPLQAWWITAEVWLKKRDCIEDLRFAVHVLCIYKYVYTHTHIYI